MMVNKQKRKMPSLTKFLIFSFSMVILMTIVVLTLQTLNPEVDYSTYYGIFCGIFGGVETLGCAVLKALKIKNSTSD